MSSITRTSVLWIGPARGPLQWLKSRIAERYQLRWMEKWDCSAVRDLELPGCQRIVVACQERLSYPSELLSELSKRFPEIPSAVAVDTWWDGAGRTGLRCSSHILLPWHRWWDGWTCWLEGTNGKLLEPCPSPGSHWRLSTERFQRTLDVNCPGNLCCLVVGNCKSTTQAWLICCKKFGAHAISAETRLFEDASQHAHLTVETPDLILLDDTSVDTTSWTHGTQQLKQVTQMMTCRFPDALVCVALSIPRWDSWKSALEYGAQELLSKPNTGEALGRLLVDIANGLSRSRMATDNAPLQR